MSALRFACPDDGTEFDTGIEIDRDTFEKCRDNRVQLLCPRCNHLHEFRVGDGSIADLRVA
jgi:hypothetical protein